MATTTSRPSIGPWPPAVLHLWLPAAIFAVAVLYQLAHPVFPNDHFDHLAKAQQFLRGEYPGIDFMDHPGRPLTIAISAGLLHLSDGTLLGEALLTMTAIALTVVLVYALALRLGGSPVLAVWAAACVLVIEPRLYNYPKLLAAMGAAWLASRYLERPSIRAACLLGGWSGVGLLFRYDLGLFTGILTAATLLLAHAPRAPRALARDAAAAGGAAVLVMMPLLLWLGEAGRLGTTSADGVVALASAARVTLRGFGVPDDGGSWVRYNAENWIYYLFLLAPILASIVVFGRRRSLSVTDRQAAALTVFCGVLVAFLIRGNLDSRLPDVAAPSFVLVAWLLAQLGRDAPPRPPVRLARPLAAAAVAVVTAVCVAQVAEARPVRRLGAVILRLPGSVARPVRLLQEDPLVAWEREGTTDVRGLARWMRECTGPDDRLLVFGYHPEVFFYSSRAFGGGMLHFHSNYFSSEDEQRLTVERLDAQRVPFVVVERSGVRALDDTYALVGAYIGHHYAMVAETDFGGGRSFLIYRHEDAGPGTAMGGLPCLVAPADAARATLTAAPAADPS
jgi:hypothetical protein